MRICLYVLAGFGLIVVAGFIWLLVGLIRTTIAISRKERELSKDPLRYIAYENFLKQYKERNDIEKTPSGSHQRRKEKNECCAETSERIDGSRNLEA